MAAGTTLFQRSDSRCSSALAEWVTHKNNPAGEPSARLRQAAVWYLVLLWVGRLPMRRNRAEETSVRPGRSPGAGLWQKGIGFLKVLAGICPLLLFSAAGPAAAEEAKQTDVEMLRSDLKKMRLLVDVQKKALLNLERRLRSLESAQKKPPAPKVSAPEPPRARPPQPQPPQPPAATTPDLASPQVEPPDRAAEAEPTKKTAEPSRALQVIAQKESGFFGGRFTIEPGISYSRFDRSAVRLRGFLALDAIFLGNISIDEVESDVITADVTGRVRITDSLQAHVNVPYVYRQSSFLSGGAGGAATSEVAASVSTRNLGDIGFGLGYRIFSETASRPDVVWNVGGRAPTGTHPFGIPLRTVEGSSGNLAVPTTLPTGNGIWEASTGFSLLKTIDPAVVFGSIEYFYNFGRNFEDIDPAPGDQPGTVWLGNSFRFGSGIAFALNEKLSLSLSYSQRFFEPTRIRAKTQKKFTTVAGSDAVSGVMNIGTTVAVGDLLTIIGNLGIGVTQDAPDVQLQLKFPINF